MPLVLIVLLAAALRFPTLGRQSIWFDEAATWDVVRQPFGEMLSRLPDRESNPPLFYVLEWLSIRVFGDGEAGLRLLSAVAGVLTVLVAFGIGRRIAGRRAGLATAALVAVNPLLVWFSQEARSYALVVLLSAWSLLLFLRCLEEDDRARPLVAWAAVSALALASHYFAVFVLLPQALWLLWRHPWRGAAVAAVGSLMLTGAALLPLLLAQRGNPYDIASESIAVRLAHVPKQFLLGYRGPLVMLLGLLAAGLVAGGVWLLLARTDWRARERALGMAAIGAVGVLLPLLAAVVGADYFNARNVLPALVPLLAVLGAAYGARRMSTTGGALLAGLCAVSIAIAISVAADSSYQRPDWAGLARALGEADGSRAVVVSPANGALALRYYRPGLETMGPDGAVVREVDVVGLAGSRDPGATPELAPLVGAGLAVSGFEPAGRTETSTYAILRFRSADGRPVPVTPDPLGVLRFGERPPAVAVLSRSVAVASR